MERGAFYMARKGQKFRKYDREFKLKVIEEHIEQGLSTTYLASKYTMSHKTIDTWVYQYKHGNRFDKKRGRTIDTEATYKEKYEILKKFEAFLMEQREKK
jgi:transposase-like protein